MRLQAEIEGKSRTVEVERSPAGLAIALDGRRLDVDARTLEGFFISLLIDGRAYEVTVEPESDSWRVQIGIDVHKVTFLDPLRPASLPWDDGTGTVPRPGGGGRRIAASVMPGKIARVLVGPGEEVSVGQGLVVVEAMKMENEVPSPAKGRVLEVNVRPGETVEAGAPLVVIG